MKKYVASLRAIRPAVSSRAVAILAATLCALASNIADAQQATGTGQIDCAQVQNARERLSCYDQQFPRNPNKPPATYSAPSPAVQSVPRYKTPQAVVAEPGAVEPQATQPAVAPAPDPDATAGLPKSKGLFELPDEVNISATIAAVRRESQKKMVFRLDNGQIWIQSSPRDLPIREGDQVTVKNATLGGFILYNDNGTSTRVQRIK